MSRRQQIAELVVEHGFQSVSTLANRFAVDPSTIRRDLDRLAADGLVHRTHGGASATTAARTSDEVISLPGHVTTQQAEKRAIGAAMAERIYEGQTVLLEGGTTCLEVARHLDHARLTVVTNDLQVGMAVATKPQINLVFVGGELLQGSTSMWGPMSIQQLETMRVNVAVFGAGTVMDDGIYASSSYAIELKRKMRSIASQSFFVADSTKFGREALFKVFGFDDFTAGITDDTLDPIRAAHFPVPLIRVTPDRE